MNPWLIRLRSVARRVGINRILAKLLRSDRYENRFSQRLLDCVSPGDVVWDIGANVGYYSTRLAARTTSTGQVVAFEPVLACAKEIEEACHKLDLENVRVVNAALGEFDGTATMHLGEDDLSATHRIELDHAKQSDRQIEVEVLTGDSARHKKGLPLPNIIKLDVEGFELECVAGMPTILQAKSLRAIFVEVHFGILESRGKPFAPRELETTLKGHGFDRCTWIDPSHLGAFRNAP